ncbi:glyoxalase III HchA [Nesterenkonia haasae]|uniref:glyoxalase III HchA n=1 Tax=Nesterenkonia haasae TaxID=2587813 RepID=UPI0013912106|nr:glyoxalase III HchA [Nesterenkonia haasae]NDK30973.1 protein deglycase HchA [Nesterenkonia haasae]
MWQNIRSVVRIGPQADERGGYSPSRLALKMATTSVTDYDNTIYQSSPRGSRKKILMVCTEQREMTMRNGKKFSTGNHPVEMLVPMLHLEKAGFHIGIVTPTGRPVAIEMWAMPDQDEAVQDIYNRYRDAFANPDSLSDFVSTLEAHQDVAAVFIPGGHGAMLGLPENEDLQRVIRWTIEEDLFMLSICHGPAALLAENLGQSPSAFAYRGYSMAVFPDRMDRVTPFLGYMPGPMPWFCGERLAQLGVNVVNSTANGTCHRDRRLITGDSPKAANAFGKLAAEVLLAESAS